MKINQIIIKRKKNIDNDNLTTAVQQMNNKHVIEFTPFSVFFVIKTYRVCTLIYQLKKTYIKKM